MRLAGDVEWLIGHFPGLTGTFDAVADPLQTLAQHLRSTSITSTVQFGIIADSVPYAGCYRVLPESGRPLIDCFYLRHGSVTPLGVADGDTLQPATPVFYIKHQTAPWGVILGAAPNFMADPREGRADQVNLASRCGLRVDAGHQAPFKLGGSKVHGGIEDRSCRTPTDSVHIGEFVKVTETGLLLSLDPYMAQLRVDAMTGLWLFYWDQLCRLAGYNFQRWTAGSVLESYDDESEHFWYHGVAPYLWEAMGRLQGPGALFKERSAQQVQKDTPEYTREEPDPDDVQEFHRLRMYRGYLGQGSKIQLACKPESAEKLLYSEETQIPGLYEAAVTLAGHAYTRTAAGWTVAKRPVIPIAKRMRPVQAASGDNPDNYKAAGEHGSGSEHKVAKEPQPQDGHTPSVRAASIMDLHAYVFNWESSHPFHYHEEDYFFPEESEIEWIDTNMVVPDYSQLKSQPYLDEPESVELEIDHRYGKQKFFKNYSYFTLLDDGGLVFGDGSGSEIRLVAGNIHLQCPGSIFLEGGVNVLSWAGRDIILRAKNSIDGSATDADVRFKAEHNMELLSGNDGGPWGTLIECRGQGPASNAQQGEDSQHAGVLLKAANAPIANWAREIYLRTGGGDVEDGIISLDAAAGQEDIITNSNFFERFAPGGCLDYFGSENNIQSANGWFPQGCGVTGPMCLTDGQIVSGTHIVDGWYLAVGGHIATEDAAAGNTEVAPLTGDALEAATAAIRQCDEFTQQTLPQIGEQIFNSVFTTGWYNYPQPGNDRVIEEAQFSFRNEQDYKTSAWFLYEARWAQLARQNGGPPDTWTEKPVTYQSQETWPFPGEKKLVGGDAYKQLDAELFNLKTQLSEDRGGSYEDPQYPSPSGQPLNGVYPIVG